MTQRDPVSPTLFKIVANSVVSPVLLVKCGPHEPQHRLGWVAVKHKIVFYKEYVRIMGRNTIWVQKTLTVIVCMF